MSSKSFVHETSIVEQGAKIGAGTKIWHFCHVMGSAEIGNGCVLGQNVFVGENVSIGNNVKIQNNVSLYDGVRLKDSVFCGPSVVFTNVKNPRSEFPAHKNYQLTLVKKGATLGANATIICGVTIGQHAFVGAGAVVTKDVPDYSLVFGNPAKLQGFVCHCGQKLEFQNDQLVCSNCYSSFKQVNPEKITPDE